MTATAKDRPSKRAPRFEANPFLQEASDNTDERIKRVTEMDKTMASITKSYAGKDLQAQGIWYNLPVDKTKFAKLYIGGALALRGLSGSGLKVFVMLFTELLENFGADKLYLNFSRIDQTVYPLPSASYSRGIKELLVNKFIAKSACPHWYYINPDFLWNGDRMSFLKKSRNKGKHQSAETT